MSAARDAPRASAARRRFLQQAAVLGGVALTLSPVARLLAAAGANNTLDPRPHSGMDAGGDMPAEAGYGPLRVARDRNTGLPLLRLPAGFSYVTFGWAGEALADGAPCPGAHDGMGVVRAEGDRLLLIRNHERETDTGVFSSSAPCYDKLCGGGTVSLQFDSATGKSGPMKASLTGTMRNCAGGVTSWGSWLSCEEFVARAAKPARLIEGSVTLPRHHGYVFEVPAQGAASAEPLLALGQFRHEAVTEHRASGHLFLTEDAEPSAGFYRFLPKRAGKLAAGGRLQMLQAEGQADLRWGLRPGQRWKTRWVEIEAPERGIDAAGVNALGVQEQGIAAGASIFTRLEGCIANEDEIFFVATNGGDASCGQVFAYYPKSEELLLVFESTDPELLDYPDNVVLSPRSGLVICQDSKTERQHLFGLTREGKLFPFALQDVVLDGAKGFGGNFRSAEWAGCCFSPDGRWLFANVYSPGFSVAITGPWRQGLI